MMLPVSILLGFAFLCLLLETLGTDPGVRKIGDRYYIVLVSVVGILSAAYFLPREIIFSSITVMTIMSLILSASQMHHARRERGEAYALTLVAYALNIWLCSTHELIYFTVLTAFLNMILVGLTYFRSNQRLAAEISIKYLLVSMFLCCLLSIAIAFTTQGNDKLALAFTWISLLLFTGATPFFNAHVDYIDAAPSFASVLLINSCLISGGYFIANLARGDLDANLFQVLLIFSAISIIIPAVLALDQQRIGRMVAYLCMTQAGVLLLLALFHVPTIEIFYLHMALAIPGALAGIRFWKHSQNSDKNWEDYAGAGRKHPLVAAAWLFTLSSLAGVPFTLGFWLYLELSRAALGNYKNWILSLIVLGIIGSMAPIARLAVFMFGKPTHYELTKLHQPRQAFLIVACALLILAAKILCFWLPKAYELQIFSF